MRHKEDRASVLGHVSHFAETLSLESSVTHGEDLIHQQNLRFEVSGDGESEAHLHAGAVMLERGINELFHFGEGYDLVELSCDLFLAHAEDGAAEKSVFAAGEFGMKPGAHFEQAAHPPPDLGEPFCGPRDASENLQEGGLARAVAADDSHHL